MIDRVIHLATSFGLFFLLRSLGKCDAATVQVVLMQLFKVASDAIITT